jgi:phenylacetate-CoA ligase
LALKKTPTEHFDKLETRSPRQREAALLAALPKLIAHAKRHAPGFSRILEKIKPEKISSRAALAALPVTRKSDLAELQANERPLGGLNATPLAKLAKVFMSPGPIYEPEGRGRNWWRTARALYAGGFRAGDLVANTFAYHFTPAGSMLESGALALGCTVVPTGVGQTEMQLVAIRDLKINAYIGTPSFLKLILEKAGETRVDISSLRKAHVGAEYLPPALRQAMLASGIRVTQSYGSADLGSIAYESLAADGSVNEGMILDEGLLLEIVRPGTGDPLPAGEVGEVVITTFNRDYPLIRFGTGDLSAVLPGADQSTKVRAMFVTPKQVNEIVRRHPEVLRARLVVEGETGNDRMTLKCEAGSRPAGLGEAIAGSIRELTKLRGEVLLVEPGALPNDGKVIDDLRKYV